MLKAKDYFFVGIQFLLFFAYTFNIGLVEFQLQKWLEILMLSISIIGLIIFILAILQLNKNLSPFPTPNSDSELVQTGLYKFVRHPIYTGILVGCSGFAIYSESIYRLIIALFLYVLFLLKTNYEERLLQQKFEEYGNYKQKTGRFFPRF
ncbi:isoprenylcysteine carboxylmethyltransferase family protein [Christiangramia sp. SM2212]|uniref:Isoprenylcysteine carboxylmethyltransferase family protein n=1 Tax=Christiangramia sediminicola TaxID=3073267 RepID=A0ABU1ES67_9FLAO|nr:isoprenylcysteine carboxylmethyltransferase family protein [Christiangramia sp. SM2212]MDR5591013.1 isoprenylcysteine carboxylmethyltransferase family protein [Christiangramia sp. SM2212]